MSSEALPAPRSAASGGPPPAAEVVDDLLRRVREGVPSAVGELFVALHGELRHRARQAAPGAAGATLRPTALVNEAFLRIARAGGPWADRAHFLRAASAAMRSVVVDAFRRKQAIKRAGRRVELEEFELVAPFEERVPDLERLDEALERLAQRDAELAQVIELHFFGGSTLTEIGAVLGLPERTVRRRFRAARTWLHRELQ
jgi:RNA polymerase sigma-70 factor (ECF subfamily)